MAADTIQYANCLPAGGVKAHSGSVKVSPWVVKEAMLPVPPFLS